MKAYLKKRFPFLLRPYRRLVRLRTEIYLRKAKHWSLEEVFSDAYKQMQHLESASGAGSTLDATFSVREGLLRLIDMLNINSLVDAPCGDFNWLSKVSFSKYLGVDIVPELIAMNTQKYALANREFRVADITKEVLPKADIILCRDCLVHLDFARILAALANFKRSGSSYLLTTTFPSTTENRDIIAGDWRPINLCKPPFNLPRPELVIDERYYEGGSRMDKSLGLWRLQDLTAKYFE